MFFPHVSRIPSQDVKNFLTRGLFTRDHHHQITEILDSLESLELHTYKEKMIKKKSDSAVIFKSFETLKTLDIS